MTMEITPLVRKLIAIAIEEDLAFGDITAALTVPEQLKSTARVIAREQLVVCGLDIVAAIVQGGGWLIDVQKLCSDGSVVEDGGVLLELKGATRDLLSAERTILNFLQRLSGVATYTRELCGSAHGLAILDTRKTMPGWRYLDKYAVRIGGGRNHRYSLGDMILVKNNHIDAHPGGIRGALADLSGKKPFYMPWEVEVRTLEELSIALEFAPTIVMLDNFSDAVLPVAMALVSSSKRRPLIEVSGGVTEDRLRTLSAAGADAVSLGRLTTHARNSDISMRIA